MTMLDCLGLANSESESDFRECPLLAKNGPTEAPEIWSAVAPIPGVKAELTILGAERT